MDDQDVYLAYEVYGFADNFVKKEFLPTGRLYVNDYDIDAYVEGLDYQNLELAVGLGKWVFFIVKKTDEFMRGCPTIKMDYEWIISAYNSIYPETLHYFLPIKDDLIQNLNIVLLRYIMEKVIPILYPGFFDSLMTNEILAKRDPVPWKIVPLDSDKKPKNFLSSGFFFYLFIYFNNKIPEQRREFFF